MRFNWQPLFSAGFSFAVLVSSGTISFTPQCFAASWNIGKALQSVMVQSEELLEPWKPILQQDIDGLWQTVSALYPLTASQNKPELRQAIEGLVRVCHEIAPLFGQADPPALIDLVQARQRFQTAVQILIANLNQSRSSTTEIQMAIAEIENQSEQWFRTLVEVKTKVEQTSTAQSTDASDLGELLLRAIAEFTQSVKGFPLYILMSAPVEL